MLLRSTNPIGWMLRATRCGFNTSAIAALLASASHAQSAADRSSDLPPTTIVEQPVLVMETAAEPGPKKSSMLQKRMLGEGKNPEWI